MSLGCSVGAGNCNGSGELINPSVPELKIERKVFCNSQSQSVLILMFGLTVRAKPATSVG
jgi:hypothetical protein